VFNMVSTPVTSRLRPTTLVSGGAAMVCLAGAWLTPISANSAHLTTANPPSAATSSASGATVRLVADVTSLPSWPAAGGPGGGPGGGSDGSPGNAVVPGPTKHESSGGSSSSASDGSVSDRASSSRDSGPVGAVFKSVGRWLGLSSDDSQASSDSAAAAPKPAKPASTASDGGAGAGKSSKAPATSGVGDVLHGVFSGVGRLLSSLFGS
jgi:hypothetical protein